MPVESEPQNYRLPSVSKRLSASLRCGAPQDTQALLERLLVQGWKKLREGRCLEAIAVGEMALKLVPSSGHAYKLLAMAECSSGDFDAAWYDINSAICAPDMRDEALKLIPIMDFIGLNASPCEETRMRRYADVKARRSRP